MCIICNGKTEVQKLGLVSTAGVLVCMRMHYLVMEDKSLILCTVVSVRATYASLNIDVNVVFNSYKGQVKFTWYM